MSLSCAGTDALRAAYSDVYSTSVLQKGCMNAGQDGRFGGSVIPFQIIGFGVALLDRVDPNPSNFVGAGVIHTKTTQVGCLLRLEPNTQAQVGSPEPVRLPVRLPVQSCAQSKCVSLPLSPQMYRLTLRTSRDTVSQRLCELLSDQF